MEDPFRRSVDGWSDSFAAGSKAEAGLVSRHLGFLVGVLVAVAACTSADGGFTSTSTSIPDQPAPSSIVAAVTLVGTIADAHGHGLLLCATEVRAPCVVGIPALVDNRVLADLIDEEVGWGRRSSEPVSATGTLHAHGFEITGISASPGSTSRVADYATIEHSAVFTTGPTPIVESLYRAARCGSSIIEIEEMSAGCELVTTSVGHYPADWTVASSNGARLSLSVDTIACSNGEPPGDRLKDPIVIEDARSVTIHVLMSAVILERASCEPVPNSSVSVMLGAPLSTRSLVGSVVP